jgi:hypothetical protein
VFCGWIVDSAPTVTNLSPATQFTLDWMLLRNLNPGVARQAVLLGTSVGYGEVYDLRAKRRIEELGEKYFLCIENVGTSTVTLGLFTRTLIALP